MATLTPEQKQRAAETRRNNRLAAERRQRNRRTLWTVLGIVALVLFGFLIWRTFQSYNTPATQTAEPTPAATAEAPTAAPTAALTDAPVPTVAPEAPVIATEAPAPVVCETIEVSKDGGLTWENAGLSLETESVYDIGNRVTWTSRATLVDKAPDQGLTDKELKLVENTWLDVRFNACSTEAVIFAYGFEMGNVKFDGGVLFAFKGEQQFRVRNGEIVLWYDQPHRDKDLGRIIDQVKTGNFDIEGPLAFALADGLKDVKVVAEYLASHPDVKIVILPQ
jgi:hypothetical protein